MHEPEVFDSTAFETQVLPYIDRNGRDVRLVIIKASFSVLPGVSPQLLDEQRPVRLGNEPWGDPNLSDNRFASDLCEHKPGTDVLIVGHAVAPFERPAPLLEVAARIADRLLLIHAHGPRYWEGLRPSLSPAAPTIRVPLRWGLAFGGIDRSDPSRPLEYADNPVGLGVARDPRSLVGQLGPQLEDPAAPLSIPNRGKAVGVGPLGVNFEPRRSYAGSYDEQWLQEVYPAKPHDYDPRFEHLAPPPLLFERPLRGQEPCIVQGVRPDGVGLAFEIPRERVRVEWVIDGRRQGVDPHLDTVLIDTDAAVLEMVWRVCIPTPAKLRRRFTEIHLWRKRVSE